MMDPDEYFALFDRTTPPDPLSAFKTQVSVTSTERLSSGCLLYRLAVFNRRITGAPGLRRPDAPVIGSKARDE